MKFTDSHEWIKNEADGTATIGVSHYAQKELGDIVYIELPIKGRSIHVGEEIAVLESTKAAADVYSPASGTILEVNSQLSSHPEWVNQESEGKGWIAKIKLTDPSELDLLMDQQAYQDLLNGA